MDFSFEISKYRWSSLINETWKAFESVNWLLWGSREGFVLFWDNRELTNQLLKIDGSVLLYAKMTWTKQVQLRKLTNQNWSLLGPNIIQNWSLLKSSQVQYFLPYWGQILSVMRMHVPSYSIVKRLRDRISSSRDRMSGLCLSILE